MSDMPPVPKDGHQTQNTQQNQFLKEIYNKEARSHIKQLKLMPRNPILAELTPREQPKSSTASSDSNSNNKPHSSKFSFTKTNPRENTFKNSFNRTETKGNHNFDKQAHSLRKDAHMASTHSESVDLEVLKLCNRRRDIDAQLQIIDGLLEEPATHPPMQERPPYNEATW